jgi:serine/threonine protein kinase
MAPEIMQLQKYDAKVIFTCYCHHSSENQKTFTVGFHHIYPELNTQADLWSVGAILYQFVTGKTPFTGNNQIQVFVTIEFLFFLYLFILLQKN